MKTFTKKILIYVVAFAMFASTGVGVFATEGVDPTTDGNSPVTSNDDTSGAEDTSGAVDAFGVEDEGGEAAPFDHALTAVQYDKSSIDVNWKGEEGKSYTLSVTDAEGNNVPGSPFSFDGDTTYSQRIGNLEADVAYSVKLLVSIIPGGSTEVDSTTITLIACERVSRVTANSSYCSIVLEWPVVADADGYNVYRYTSSSNAQKKINGSKIPSSRIKLGKNGNVSLTDNVSPQNGKFYWYRVYAYRYATNSTKPLEAIESANANNVAPVKPMYITVKPKMNRTLTSKDKYKKKYRFKKGQVLTSYGYNAGCYYFKYKVKGREYTYRISRINSYGQSAKYTKKVDNYNDYTVKEAELFVKQYMNAKGSAARSKTSNLIWVSYHTQRLYVFAKKGGEWKCMKNWDCSTGKAKTPSPTGNKMINKYRYRNLVGIPYWSCYSSKNGIHGKRPSYKLGEPHSHGCIRNKNENAKWVFYNIKKGTRVICY